MTKVLSSICWISLIVWFWLLAVHVLAANEWTTWFAGFGFLIAGTFASVGRKS